MAADKKEKAYVFAAKNGNQKCFGELYKLHYQEVYAIALTVTRHKNEAEEVLRATFATAWQELNAFEPSADFGLWIRNIARRKCGELTEQKQKAHQVREEEPLIDDELQDVMIPPVLAMDIFQQVFHQGAESVTVNIVPDIPVTPEPPVPETHVTPETYHKAPVADKVAPPVQHSVPSGGGSATSGAASSAVKSAFPLWAKITAGVLGASVAVGGGIVAYRTISRQNDPVVSAAVGDEINFGTYEQDNNSENGAENITWRVLDRKDDKLFVVSKYVLDSAVCEDLHSTPIWCDTKMREKLNKNFFGTAFSEKEQNAVCNVYVLSEDTWVQTEDDVVSVEKVFLLSQYETGYYFSSDDDRIALATEYAAANGARTDAYNHAVWWTRSTVFENDRGAVYENGDNSGERGGHSGDRFGVRPAMWIDTKAVAAEDGKAREVVQPVSTTHLPKSLRSFLSTFALHFDNGTYDCENITEASNILYGVIGERECVDYAVYSAELAEENSHDNWIDPKETPSPVPEINAKNSVYKVLDAEKVDAILKNIFHCTDSDIQTMRGWQYPTNPYGYADGKYYCTTGGNGSLANQFKFADCSYKDGCCFFTVTYYHEGYDVKGFDSAPPETMYVKASLLPHEGTPWWSLYYYSTEPFSPAPLSDQKSEYNIETDAAVVHSATEQDKADTPTQFTEVTMTEKPAEVSAVKTTAKPENTDVFREYTLNSDPDENDLNIMIRLNDETSFTGHYEKNEGSDIYLCDFHGELGSFRKESGFMYKADILSMEADRPVGTEKIGDITYHYVEASEVYQVKLQFLRVFTPDTPNTAVTKRILRHVHPDENDTSDTINVYYLLINDMYGLIQKD